MSQFNFDEIVDRRNTNSYKWDSASASGIIPLWVADMDFRTAPAVQEALMRRVQHGVFGYVRVPDAYYEALINWFGRKHGWLIKRESVIYTSGVVPAISAIIKALTQQGDKVLVQTPVYNCFFSSIRNNDCQMEESRLVMKNGRYEIDFADFERKAADPQVKVFLLCNPHNPAGRVWSVAELRQMAEICLRHNVFVIADEIHCELVFSPNKYTPYGSLGADFERNAAICTSPSKAFNIAGLQIANIVATDAEIRKRIDKAININEVCDINPFGVEALIAAYNEGEEWLNELISYLYGNYLFAKDFIEREMPQLKVTELEGTYLLWVDFRALGLTSEVIEKMLLDKAKVWLNAGTMYGEAGEGFMRINLACPRSVLSKGLYQIKKALL